MDRKIIVKEIEKYSNDDKTKTLSEFLIYYVIGERNIEAYTEFGEKNKKLRVNEILLKYFVYETDVNWKYGVYPIEEIFI